MSWHIHKDMSFAASDGYGCDTDLIPSVHARMENKISPQIKRALQDGYNDWVRETAYEYFDTSDWDEEFWDAWHEIVKDNTY